jgi:hypothetical protein
VFQSCIGLMRIGIQPKISMRILVLDPDLIKIECVFRDLCVQLADYLLYRNFKLSSSQNQAGFVPVQIEFLNLNIVR